MKIQRLGKKFEVPLLLQALLMIVAQWLLLSLCVRLRRGVADTPNAPLAAADVPIQMQPALANFQPAAVVAAATVNGAASALSSRPGSRKSGLEVNVPPDEDLEDDEDAVQMQSAFKALLDPRQFWNWPQLETYRMFMTLFTGVFLLLHLVLGGYGWYGHRIYIVIKL